MKYFSKLFAFVLFSLLIMGSCQKDPEVITNTVIKHDTLSVTVHDTLFIHDTLQIENMIFDTATYFFIVRHAEKKNGNDPDLTAEGQARANELKRMLNKVALDGIFTTNYKRTTQTVQPTAEAQGLSVETYTTNKKLIQTVLENDNYSKVLVAGHSNTVPDLVNRLTGENTYSNLGENEYDNLFLVAYYDEHRSDVFVLKYGD